MNCLKDENIDWYRWLEKRVCVKGTVYGTLKYFGTTKFSDGLWCGIELDEPVGKNNGIVNNIKYFTCLPKFGIFVPVSKVCKIESEPKCLNDTFVHLNGTVQMQNCQGNTTLVLGNEGQPYNCNKENEDISEIKNDEAWNIRQDSEESLGLLDPNLIESLDSFNLDAPSDFDALLKPDNQGLDFVGHNLPTSDILFSDEIRNPKYASTPRNPVKKRFTNFSQADKMGHALQNVNEHDVFENEIDFGQNVFFDSEKFKKNPNLASTCEIPPIPCISSNTSMNILSPVSCNPILQSDSLNKTQILPAPLLTNHDIIIPVSMDFNKTQTLQNECQATVSNVDILSTTFKMPSETDSTETKDLNLTVSLQTSDGPENCKKSIKLETAGITSCNNMNLNSTFDGDLKFADAALQKIATNVNDYSDFNLNKETATISLSKTFNSDSSSPQLNVVNKDISLLQKTFILDSSLSEKEQNIEQAQFVDAFSNAVQFEPFDYKSKILEENVILEKSLSDVNKRNSVCIPATARKSLNCSRRFSNSFGLNSTFKKNKVISNVSITSKIQNKNSSVQLKANNVDTKTSEFKRPYSVYSSICKSKAPLKKSAAAKENNSCLKESVSVNSTKPLVSEVEPKNIVSSVNVKLEQEKKKGRFYSTENKSMLPSKSLVSSRRFSYSLSTETTVQTSTIRDLPLRDKDNRGCRFSYSESAEATVESNTMHDLPLTNKDNRGSKFSSKINFSASSRTLPTKDLSVHDTSKVSFSSIKNTVLGKRTVNQTSNAKNPSRLKEPITKNNLLVSQQSFGLSSNGFGIPRRNSLAAGSKTKLPIGSRYSMLPSVEERSLCEAKNTVRIEQMSKVDDPLDPEAVPVVSSCTKANSIKTSRIASLPQKSQIATRKMGQKYSDVKEECGACPKIPRYNLRGKK